MTANFKLQINEPVELALTRPDPKRYQNEGKPPSMMYSIVTRDGTEDKIFVSPMCSAAIEELQIKPHEFFTLCRRKTSQGKEYYEVHSGKDSTISNKLPTLPADAPARIQPGSAGHTRASSLMGAALITAIDAATLAQQYAASKGIALEFGAADLRAIAATLYIQAAKDRYSMSGWKPPSASPPPPVLPSAPPSIPPHTLA